MLFLSTNSSLPSKKIVFVRMCGYIIYLQTHINREAWEKLIKKRTQEKRRFLEPMKKQYKTRFTTFCFATNFYVRPTPRMRATEIRFAIQHCVPWFKFWYIHTYYFVYQPGCKEDATRPCINKCKQSRHFSLFCYIISCVCYMKRKCYSTRLMDLRYLNTHSKTSIIHID